MYELTTSIEVLLEEMRHDEALRKKQRKEGIRRDLFDCPGLLIDDGWSLKPSRHKKSHETNHEGKGPRNKYGGHR
ncbi:hypothetical protein [Pseudomonas phage LUZ7]|uniref:Uncharacterized protein n=1 Tax=Pseudomonas phage LUZ7 TaxID=655097 RepID=C8ZKB5_9CAUD|nr:hypothetical protein PP-LUZ7_gp016 [Pseudomonas phage LUZ7]CAZ66157.1 hypothetical protein [Pseudomonas phage LUZ7]